MRYILATIRLILLAINTILFISTGRLLYAMTHESPKVSRFIVRNWAKASMLILNIRVHRTGQEPIKHAILMSNHRSYIEIFSILSVYPATIVAKKELGDWPILKGAVHIARMILVDRGRTSSLIRTMQSIKNEIDSGGNVILFPEGGIRLEKLTSTFKHGSFKIAFDTDTPVIPTAISYPDKGCYWGKESFIKNFYRQMGKWRTDTNLWIGAPIKAESMESLMQATKETIDSKLLEFIEEENRK